MVGGYFVYAKVSIFLGGYWNLFCFNRDSAPLTCGLLNRDDGSSEVREISHSHELVVCLYFYLSLMELILMGKNEKLMCSFRFCLSNVEHFQC